MGFHFHSINFECKFLSIKNIGVFRRYFISADLITSLLTIDNANLVFVINCLKIKRLLSSFYSILLKEIVCQQKEKEVFY